MQARLAIGTRRDIGTSAEPVAVNTFEQQQMLEGRSYGEREETASGHVGFYCQEPEQGG